MCREELFARTKVGCLPEVVIEVLIKFSNGQFLLKNDTCWRYHDPAVKSELNTHIGALYCTGKDRQRHLLCVNANLII